ncbi:hypothetical protein SNE40_022068 [Patella caerulea]|uniref:Profilin n=1 Tax=Patella caerulea TaxID=87958 RepID=A0AAN8GD62_PATCE
MSGWDAWSQQLLTRKIEGVKHRSAQHGGIFGLDGKLWAGTDAFMKKKINPQSFKKVEGAIAKGAAFVSKLEFGDKKFFVLKNDPGSKFVIGKSTQKGAGCTIARAKSCFVLGIYDNDQVQPSNNTSQVCYVRDQLMAAGY